ncbi:NADH dehydrogenase [ubiquinone] 1 beta subcomplex subunit 2, mitochondrial-like [Orcinus orca]|uniref:NADH dehydrogenase [ubiquinone] 1 beta subcomplex subunit 2, mitochondrial-like n=1 Tax=Orcinus orca TaxID=9733 RepID=UPI0014412B2A|nr:NADH dehydrogenase [ubiquinone] 1 beta subcomplex subunit 2, mitochondrial-like [Orcinus orca]
MSARTRQTPFPGVGGHFFRGCRARVAEGAGVRHAGGGVHIEPRYRLFPQLTRSQVIKVEFFSAIMWFWILWRFWHDSDAVLGHFPYPDPSQWTDEELGILPDDETENVDSTLSKSQVRISRNYRRHIVY